MDYGKIMVLMSDPTGTVPADADLSCLRFKGRWDYDYRPIPSKAIRALRERGIKVVSDLDDMSEEDLTKIPGVGSATAEKLLHAAKKADVNYRGIGFPWEVKVKVRVPKAYIESVRKAGEKEVSEVLAEMFNAEDFFENLSEHLKAAKKAEIQRRIEELNEQLRELDAPVAKSLEEHHGG